MDLAKAKVEANFEFCEKLGVPFSASMTEISHLAETLKETNKRLDVIVAAIKDRMKDSDVKLLWEQPMPSNRRLHMVLLLPAMPLFCLCGRTGQKGHGNHNGTRRPELCVLGGREL